MTGVDLESAWVEAAGLRLHARRALGLAPPGRPPLVLVHGVAVSSRNMRPTAEAFAPHLPVHAPDLPGHGRSDKADHVLDAPELADALAAWMAATEVSSACVLGNSFGCQVAAELAVRHAESVERLVLQGPTPDPTARGYTRQVLRWLRNSRRERSTQAEVTLKDWRDAGLAVLVGTFRHSVRHRIEDVLPHIKAPTLVVRGEHDPIVPQRWADEATRLIPNGRLVVLEGASHTITNTRPEQLVELALPFLLDRPPVPGPAAEQA